jgi:hypothetical protein
VVEVPAATPPTVPDRLNEPMALWDSVVKARALVTLQRNLPRTHWTFMARADLLSALEAYVACLTNHGRPIPYALRDELRIRRAPRHDDRWT